MRGRLALLALLYVSQGLPFGYQVKALPLQLRAQGASLTSLGLLRVLSLPWLLKGLWAPLVDRWHWPSVGRRRSWLLPLQSLLVLCALAAAAMPVERVDVVAPLLLVFNLLAATQDIAVDGLAVDMLQGADLGAGNAAQVVGYKVGMLLGGGVLLWAGDALSPQGAFRGMALVMFTGLVGVVGLSESESSGGVQRKEDPPSFRDAAAAVARRPRLAALALTYKTGEAAADALFKPLLLDRGVPMADIGFWSGVVGLGASIAGSLAGGWLADRSAGALRWLIWARLAPAALQWAVCALGWTGAAPLAIVLESVVGGAVTTAMFAVLMGGVDPRVGASHFTVLSTLEVLGKTAPGALAGPAADALGYTPVFTAAAALGLLPLWFLAAGDSRVARRPSPP